MREIAFRVWDGEIMHTVSELIFCMGPNLDGKGLKFYGPGVGQGWIDGKTVHLMQYTGLKDKNGMEIYEKDILLFNNSINNRKWVCVVEFRAGGFVCEYPKDGMYNHFDSWNAPKVTWKVIGNIYENPELLETPHEP